MTNFDLKYIYRFEEPLYTGEKEMTITKIDTLIIKLSNGKRDMEAFMIDPKTATVFLMSKREENVFVYVLPYPYAFNDTLDVEPTLTLHFKNIVADSISPDGKEVLMKTYNEILYWKKEDNQSYLDLLKTKALRLPYRIEKQGEAITWTRSASGYFTVSESVNDSLAQLLFYKRN